MPCHCSNNRTSESKSALGHNQMEVENSNYIFNRPNDYKRIKHSIVTRCRITITGIFNYCVSVNTRRANKRSFSGGTSRAQRKSKNYTAPDVPVAFSAYRNIAGTVGAGQSIVFNVVYVDQGNGYHQNHGLFIAPQSGIYVFLVSLMHSSQSKPGHHSIMKMDRSLLASILNLVNMSKLANQLF